MPETFLDLNNPFEKRVSERLEKCLKLGLPHDLVLDMIARDFPCMDAKVRDYCANTVYRHYHSGPDGNKAIFKHVALLHSSFIDESFDSHKGRQFHIKEGEDIVAAVMMENPVYLHDKSNIHLKFYVDDIQVNEFRHTMAMEERRSVYYVPLKILENKEFHDETSASIKIDVIDENIEGKVYSVESDVYYGDTDPSEIFELQDFKLFCDYEDTDSCVFDLDLASSLNLHVRVKHSQNYGYILNLDGVVTISPSDSSDKRNNLVRNITLKNLSGISGSIKGRTVLCNIDTVFCKDVGTIPFFRPEPGKYIVNFFLLNTLLYGREIEFTRPCFEWAEFEEEES